MKIIFQFAKLFAPLKKTNKLLQDPLSSRNQARKIPFYYQAQLPSNEIDNLLKSLEYFSPNDIISIIKKSIKYRQVFGKAEFTEYFLRNTLDSVQMANLILLCYKLNFNDEVWIKCLSMDVENLTPYYLSETMWALKQKVFTDPEIELKSHQLQCAIVKRIPSILENFDFYCLSLMMQSLSNDHNIDWNQLALHFFKVAQSKDYFSLCYGLYALAKHKHKITIEIDNVKIVNLVKEQIVDFKQNDLLLILWSLYKLQFGTEEFWTYSYKFLKAQKLQTLQSIAMQSQILSQLYRVEEYQWTYIEEQTLNKMQSDEKSLVTIFQTFSLNKKGSEKFWIHLTKQILKDIQFYKFESIFNLASHSEIADFSNKLPLEWKQLTVSQQCLIFNKFAKIGIDVSERFQLILGQIDQVKGRDLVLVLYTIYKYAIHLEKEKILAQLLRTAPELNGLDVEQLLELKDLPIEIYKEIMQYHGKSLNYKQRDMWNQLQVNQ